MSSNGINSLSNNLLSLATQSLRSPTLPGAAAPAGAGQAGPVGHSQLDKFSGSGMSASFAASFAFSASFSGSAQGAHHCHCHCEAPSPSESSHPAGGLKSDGNVVTTPGGYKIQSTGATSLTITGPDGKSSTISGDPHVNGSDGNHFDFKKNSTFVLDDGTKINIKTTPPSGPDGVTVAASADITNGDDHVAITDLDKGQGKVSQVTQDAQNVATDADTDEFKEAGNASHWAKDGKELIAGDKNGDYKLGQDVDTSKTDAALNGLDDTLNNGDVQDAGADNTLGQKPYDGKQGLTDAISQIRDMLAMVSSLIQMLQQVQNQGAAA